MAEPSLAYLILRGIICLDDSGGGNMKIITIYESELQPGTYYTADGQKWQPGTAGPDDYVITIRKPNLQKPKPKPRPTKWQPTFGNLP